MTINPIFFFIFAIIALIFSFWKYAVWLFWRFLRFSSQAQASNLILGYNYIEITGAAGVGKSWLLMHLFKHLQGVKFTNTQQGTHTLTRDTLEYHYLNKWARPNKWYYFLDDISLWQDWCKQEFGKSGYKAIIEWLTNHANKQGGVLIWTNNDTEIKRPLRARINCTLEVQKYYNFTIGSNEYSFLFVNTSETSKVSLFKWWPTTIVAIDNQEIKVLYDSSWNIPREVSQNYYESVYGRLRAGGLCDIVKVIEEGYSEDELKSRNVDLDLVALVKRYVKIEDKKTAEAEEIKGRRMKSSYSSGLLKMKEKLGEEEEEDKEDEEDEDEDELDLDVIHQDPQFEDSTKSKE